MMFRSLNERAKMKDLHAENTCSNRAERRKDLKVKMRAILLPERECKRKKRLTLKKMLRQRWMVRKRIEAANTPYESTASEDASAANTN